MLTALGATAAEDRVYGFLVTTVSAGEDEIVTATGLSHEEARSALESLVERGLAERMAETATRFVAASPTVIESMVSERLVELRTAQEGLDELTAQYRANSLARTADGVFEIVRGCEALRRCSLRLLRSATSEVLNLVKPPLIALQPEERIGPAETVRNRIVYEGCALAHDGIIDALRTGWIARDEARVHTKLPIKMLLVDRSVAMLPLAQHDTTPVGVLVRESAVLDAMLALFEYVWATAVPLQLSEQNGDKGVRSALSADNRELLSLLLAGLSDEAIAMHRGMSVRTVQRKVHALMEVANVQTRMQLAWEAAHRGWLGDADVELEDHSPVASVANGDAPRLESPATDLVR